MLNRGYHAGVPDEESKIAERDAIVRAALD
jgi:hypothetical protein